MKSAVIRGLGRAHRQVELDGNGDMKETIRVRNYPAGADGCGPGGSVQVGEGQVGA